MDLLQTIFTNNKLVAEALEQAEPVVRRLSGKMAGRLRAGGRIICLGAGSAVPEEYGAGDIFLAPASDDEIPAVVSRNDIFIAVDCGDTDMLAGQMRTWRRRGMLTACITCGTASAVASAAEIAVKLSFETVAESRPLKERAALQMALDALLTHALAEAGIGPSFDITTNSHGDALSRAAVALIKECPALDTESAAELIQRHGSVRKAAKAYKANVQGEL